jgi:hypothetical protein
MVMMIVIRMAMITESRCSKESLPIRQPCSNFLRVVACMGTLPIWAPRLYNATCTCVT